MIEINIISLKDDLDGLVTKINEASWDAANEISVYDTESLRAYLERQDTVFITCDENIGNDRILLGMASSRIEIKPYAKELWLYVDELDVCADQRQRGAGKLLMQKLISIAKSEGCSELWLGTEIDNIPANCLYKSISPSEVLEFIGYTYEIGR